MNEKGVSLLFIFSIWYKALSLSLNFCINHYYIQSFWSEISGQQLSKNKVLSLSKEIIIIIKMMLKLEYRLEKEQSKSDKEISHLNER